MTRPAMLMADSRSGASLKSQRSTLRHRSAEHPPDVLKTPAGRAAQVSGREWSLVVCGDTNSAVLKTSSWSFHDIKCLVENEILIVDSDHPPH